MFPALKNFGATIAATTAYLTNNYFCGDPRKKSYHESCFGTLKKIIIYPLHGGIPFEVKEAICTESGLQSGDLVDRSYVLYNYKLAILDFHYTNITKQKIEALLEKIREHQLYHSSLQKKVLVQIYYLGLAIEVEDLGDDLAAVAQNILGYSSTTRIAYCSPKTKKDLMSEAALYRNDVFIEDVDYMSPYFAQYTLMNSKSIQHIEAKTRKSISPSNFHANLVFEGPDAPAFCEDHLFHLSIGKDVEFGRFQLCTHINSAFENQPGIPCRRNQEPYAFLKRIRTVHETRSDDESDCEIELPMFGMNMSCEREGKIKLGDVVTGISFR